MPADRESTACGRGAWSTTLAVCLLAAVGTAQTVAVLGPRNAAFLEGLWRAGYIDQADNLGKLVAASDLPEAEKKAVEGVHTRLRIAVAARAGDALGRRDLVVKGIEQRTRDLQAADPKSEAGMALAGDLVEQHRLLADAVVEALGQQEDPEQQAALRKDAANRFKAAEELFATCKGEWEKFKDDAVAGSEVPFLIAFYGLGRIQYYHSLIHAADSPFAKRQAEIALDTLQDFDLDFSDSLAAFEAKLTQALCHQRLGNVEFALSACDDAIALRERFDRSKDGVYQVDRDAADVIAAAVLQKTMLLADQKEFGKVVDSVKDYLATVASPLDAQQGPATLAAMAKAHFELGETDAASKEAQQLIDLDPRGQWGRRGQELLGQLISSGSGKGVDAGKTLRIAESLAVQGDHDQALRMCREAAARAASGDDGVAAESMLITGAVYATRGWFHEASVAFDAVVRRFPKSEHAPDALWRSIQCFVELDESDRLPTFKRLIEDRSKQLVRDYPDDPHVGQLQLLEGQRLERAQKFLAAAQVYEAVAADSSVHLEARYRAANCHNRHARSLANAGQERDTAACLAKALAGFQSVLTDIEAARLAATDARLRQRLDQVEFGTRVALTNLLLTGAPRTAEAASVLAALEVDDKDAQAPVVWALRIRLQLAEGQLDDAAAAMHEALGKGADTRPLLPVCRALAMALDNKAVERGKANDRVAAQQLSRRAVGLYVRGAVGAPTADAVQIADRLRVIGMIDNRLDEKVESWFEVPGFEPTALEAWQGALAIYQRLTDAEAMNTRSEIGLARLLGFVGRWNECEAELTRLVAKEKLVANRRLDSGVLAKKPELLTTYVELGFALQRATSGDEKSRRARATDVFDRLVTSVPADSRHWWYARFGQVQTLFDRGLYDQADVSLSSLERTNPDYDGGRFGLGPRLRVLRTSINQKIPKKK